MEVVVGGDVDGLGIGRDVAVGEVVEAQSIMEGAPGGHVDGAVDPVVGGHVLAADSAGAGEKSFEHAVFGDGAHEDGVLVHGGDAYDAIPGAWGEGFEFGHGAEDTVGGAQGQGGLEQAEGIENLFAFFEFPLVGHDGGDGGRRVLGEGGVAQEGDVCAERFGHLCDFRRVGRHEDHVKEA